MRIRYFFPLFFIAISIHAVEITRDTTIWQPIEIHLEGPSANEMDTNPNPFLDYRLQAQFISPDGRVYHVPGFFNGNGKGEGSGKVWTVRFSADSIGEWKFSIAFHRGKEIAVSLDPNAGTPTDFHGTKGTFHIKANPHATGFYAHGRLLYTGEHYLQFSDGRYWIKGGCDSPEDFLAYADFDNTLPSHQYAPHIPDWKDGDPTWKNGKGKAIIGSLNHLAEHHVNSIYFLTCNIGGDGKNVWPFAADLDPKGNQNNDNLHYDISKLHQWNIVFTHAQKKGLLLHFVLNEAEENNKRELDDGKLGIERKLYYREIIARFGHHLALQWNISEEYDLAFAWKPEEVKAFAQYIQDIDPYDHPITVHNKGRDPYPNWLPFLGDARFGTTSLQTYQHTAEKGKWVEKWRTLSAKAGRKLPINLDEFLEADLSNQVTIRKEVLWPTYLSGGNLEIILESKLKTEEFHTMASLWDWTWYARKFVEENLPFWDMEPTDSSIVESSNDMGGAQCFSKNAEIYAIYFPKAIQTGKLSVENVKGRFSKQWYNPRTGKFEGKQETIQLNEPHPIGSPPGDTEEDWALLIKKSN